MASFDRDLFGIASSECLLLDPQQRLLLEAAWETASTSSLVQQKLQPQPGKGAAAAGNSSGSGRRILQSHLTTGVFVGASYAEWALLQQQHRVPQSTYTASGSGLSVLAGRISYTFGWCGPATVSDTACSSSLVALSSAHNCLQVGHALSIGLDTGRHNTLRLSLRLLPNDTALLA